MAAAALSPGEACPKRSIRYSDIPSELRAVLPAGVSESRFADFVRSIEQRTAEREREGKNDHLIYFLLQSRRFTQQPKIEPALSAYEFAQSLTSEERAKFLQGDSSYLPPPGKIPKSVLRRIDDFIRALDRRTTDERLRYFRELVRHGRAPAVPLPQFLDAEYARSMRFLYQKEFLTKEMRPLDKGLFLSSLYERRGHSTDAGIEANFAVWTALSVLKSLNPSLRLNRVLIVGPGLDFAPRTGLMDAVPPQSYQPYAVADALLDLGLSDLDQLHIHCVDINSRVIAYFDEFPKREVRKLILVSPLQKAKASADFEAYFEGLGRQIGAGISLERKPAKRNIGKSLLVRSDVAERITAARRNIVTERDDPSPEYDLVVVTNVFLYFNQAELLLALSNIESMIKAGGYLVHNEFRPELESLARTLRLEPVQARTLRLGGADDSPLLDGFVIHRKSSEF